MDHSWRRMTSASRARAFSMVLGLCLAFAYFGAVGVSEAAPLADHVGPRGQAEIAAFVDRQITGAMNQNRIPGVAFVMVKDGKIVYAKGYGYANVARKTPVLPNRTVFRLASISKVFTATAVMQLAEQGHLDLHADVNRYLTRFKVPDTYAQPITLADLLTHTSGFEDRSIGQSSLDASGLTPLSRFLANGLPARVEPPGTLYSYSNWNTSLAGYVVEAVARTPFSQYMQRQVLQPLAMARSTFAQPLPRSLAGNLAVGYEGNPGDASRQAGPFEYLKQVPAAALSGTATDIAQFMIAQLQGGRYGSSRILKPATVRELQALHFSDFPAVEDRSLTTGMAYGFERYQLDGQLVLSKDGQTRGYGSLLTLLPEQHLGWFIVGNIADNDYEYAVQHALIAHYYGPKRRISPPTAPASLRGSTSQFDGTYWSNQYARTTIEKLRQLTQQTRITGHPDGTVTIEPSDSGSFQVTRVRPLLFEAVFQNIPYYWGFRRDADGQMHFLVGNNAFNRIQWYETTQVQEAFIGILCLLFLTGVVRWLLVPLVSTVRGQRTALQTVGSSPLQARIARLAPSAAGVACALDLIFIIVLLVVLNSATSTTGYSWIEYGVPLYLYVLLCIPLITTVLAVVLPVAGVTAWRVAHWTWLSTVHYVLVAAAVLAFIPFLVYWNLLGFNF